MPPSNLPRELYFVPPLILFVLFVTDFLVVKGLAKLLAARKPKRTFLEGCDGSIDWYICLVGSLRRHRFTKSKIVIPLRTRTTFRIEDETGWHRFFKWTGLTKETQLGEGHFDNKFFFVSESSVLNELLRSDPIFAKAFKMACSDGYRFECDGLRLVLSGLDLSSAKRNIGYVVEVAKRIMKADRDAPREKTSLKYIDAVFQAFLVALTLASMTYALTYYHTFDRDIEGLKTVVLGALLAILACMVLLIPFLAIFRGSSRGPGSIASVSPLLFISLLLGSPLAIRQMNETLSDDPVTEVTAQVVAKSDYTLASSNRHFSRSYRSIKLGYSSVHSFPVPDSIPVLKEFLDTLEIGDKIVLKIRIGRLGLAYLASAGPTSEDVR